MGTTVAFKAKHTSINENKKDFFNLFVQSTFDI